MSVLALKRTDCLWTAFQPAIHKVANHCASFFGRSCQKCRFHRCPRKRAPISSPRHQASPSNPGSGTPPAPFAGPRAPKMERCDLDRQPRRPEGTAAVRVKYSRTERDRLPKATRRASVTDDILPLIFTKRLCEFDHNLALSKIPKDEAFNRAADFYLRFTGLHSHTESIAA